VRCRYWGALARHYEGAIGRQEQGGVQQGGVQQGGAAAAAAEPPGAQLLLATTYRAYKKMLLWDLLLGWGSPMPPAAGPG
jgi:hypothetical protein